MSTNFAKAHSKSGVSKGFKQSPGQELRHIAAIGDCAPYACRIRCVMLDKASPNNDLGTPCNMKTPTKISISTASSLFFPPLLMKKNTP